MNGLRRLPCVLFLALAFARPAGASLPEAEAALDRGDHAAARLLLEQPAAEGDPAAEELLGHMLLFGSGGPVDEARGADLIRRAADRGRPEAQNTMGVLYMTGRLGAADPAQGLSWFRKAAANGHSFAMFNLGRAAEQGLGGSPSLTEARSWYEQAARLGNDNARARLEELNAAAASAREKKTPSKQPGSETRDRDDRRASGRAAPNAQGPPAAAGSNHSGASPPAQADPKRAAPTDAAALARRQMALRATDTAPLPLQYSLADASPRQTQKPVHASGLELGQPRLSRRGDAAVLECILYNRAGELRTGTFAFFVEDHEGVRAPVPAAGDPAFRLRNQVSKHYRFQAADLAGGQALIVQVTALDQSPLERRVPLE